MPCLTVSVFALRMQDGCTVFQHTRDAINPFLPPLFPIFSEFAVLRRWFNNWGKPQFKLVNCRATSVPPLILCSPVMGRKRNFRATIGSVILWVVRLQARKNIRSEA